MIPHASKILKRRHVAQLHIGRLIAVGIAQVMSVKSPRITRWYDLGCHQYVEERLVVLPLVKMSEEEVCSICSDAMFPQTDSTHACHRLACGHSFHVDCIVQWFAHGQSSCPNCRYEDVMGRIVKRDLPSRISSARRRKNTPVEVRRLIKQYDDTKARHLKLKHEIRQHHATNREVYTIGNRLRARACHYAHRERMLRMGIGHMCIPGVPLADRYRIAPVSNDDEVEQ